MSIIVNLFQKSIVDEICCFPLFVVNMINEPTIHVEVAGREFQAQFEHVLISLASASIEQRRIQAKLVYNVVG